MQPKSRAAHTPHNIGAYYKPSAVGLRMVACYFSVTSNKSELCSKCSKRSYQYSVFRYILLYLTGVSTLLGHVTSLGITMLSSCHYPQCSINSHRAFVTYLTPNLVIQTSRVFSCPGSLLILETAIGINANLCLLSTALSSLGSYQYLPQLCYLLSPEQRGELTFAFFPSYPITPAAFKTFATKGPYQRAQRT